jgi:diaminohydroxyphosphoribosylaminopyrimidine deaminase/5-amino-6-(5-phosphoribosylamino)uracil reductase
MEMLTPDEKFMQRALDLAEKGLGAVEPNPAVGAVIVKNGKVIGEGYHEKFAEPHAEINALADCKDNGFSPEGATMYVTLEPCCHGGKTGPCTDAIIDAKIAKVIAAIVDPSAHASGKGLDKLRNAGIEINIGVCAEQAALINAPFIKFAKTARPWVILKWAQSTDGVIGFKDSAGQKWISNETSRQDVHNLRRRTQAVLAGINTVIADDPLLTPRPDQGKKPLRVVLDSRLKIPLDRKVLDTSHFPTLIVTTNKTLQKNPEKAAAIIQTGAEILAVTEKNRRCDLDQVLGELGKRNIRLLLVEGGPAVITSFITSKLADEIKVYIAPKSLDDPNAIKITKQMKLLTNPASLLYPVEKDFCGDKCIKGLLRHPDKW